LPTGAITLSGTQTIDGIPLIAGNRVLVKDQGSAANGIYVVVDGGAWTRAEDADENAEVTSGLFTFVEEGSINGGNGYVLTTPDPITLDTTTLTFVQFSGAGQIVEGPGITVNANTVSVNPGDGLELTATQVQVDNTVIRTTGTQTLGDAKTFTSPVAIDTSNNTTLDLDSGSTTNLIDFNSSAMTIGLNAGTATWSNGSSSIMLTGAAGTATVDGDVILTDASTFNTVIGTDADIDTSGASVLDTLVMTDGVIQSHSTRTLTPADISAATAAQGSTADSAVQPNDNVSDLVNDAGYVSSSGNTIIGTDSDLDTSGALVVDQLTMTDGVIQSHSTRTLTPADISAATAAQGSTADSAVQPNDNVSDLVNDAGYEVTSAKGANNGYCGLDASGLVDPSNLPSYVDDVIESANFAALPGTGETGKIYVTLDDNKTYRWGGSSYTYITSGAVDTVAGKTGTVVLVEADITDMTTYVEPNDNVSDLVNDAGYVTSSGNTIIGTDTNVLTSGPTVIEQINMTDGVIQSHTTRTLTLANLGYTGATNANYITNNNQLSNGAGYVTSSGNTIIGTDGDINTSGASVVGQLNMTDGVIQSHTTRTLTLAQLGYTGATNANYFTYSHPTTYSGDDFSIDTTPLTGATVISDLDINVTTDTSGHVVDANGSVATRTLTLANLGYTGATNVCWC